ncbi:MAG: GAF domain-containing protein, partial [Endomicrobiales bacterium]
MNVTPEKFRHLLEANRILSSTLRLGELLRQVMKLATEMVEAETASLLLYDECSDELLFDLALTEKESQLKQIRLKRGEGIAGCVAAERKALVVNDVTADGRWTSRADSSTRFTTRSVLAVPMLYQGRLLGVVEAINKRTGPFTPEDTGVLEAFAAQAAVAVENARNFERLQEEKDKIEAVFSQMSDGALFIGREGNKLLSNAAAARLLGTENLSRGTLAEI